MNGGIIFESEQEASQNEKKSFEYGSYEHDNFYRLESSGYQALHVDGGEQLKHTNVSSIYSPKGSVSSASTVVMKSEEIRPYILQFLGFEESSFLLPKSFLDLQDIFRMKLLSLENISKNNFLDLDNNEQIKYFSYSIRSTLKFFHETGDIEMTDNFFIAQKFLIEEFSKHHNIFRFIQDPKLDQLFLFHNNSRDPLFFHGKELYFPSISRDNKGSIWIKFFDKNRCAWNHDGIIL